MLAKTLLADTFSVLLALGSFAFYFAGFFYPEVHRRTDLVWSGLGLLYAALLWFCAGQMTVAVLLAQLIVVALLLGLGWQTLSVRREKTPVYQQTPIAITPDVVRDWTKNQLNQLRIAPKESVPVRLEKRASGQQLDPRRRPAYDYEFVEDGLVDMAPATNPIAEATEALSEVLGEVLSVESLALDADKTDAVASERASGMASERASEIIVEVPPSVEAKIISVEAPDVTEPVGVAPATTDPAIPEPSTDEPLTDEQLSDNPSIDETQLADVSDVVEASTSIKEATDKEATDKEAAEVLTDVAKDEPLVNSTVDTRLAPEPVQTVLNSSESDSSESDEDWGDELFGDTPIESASADSFEPQLAQSSANKAKTPPIASTREKPSLLAMPVILVGWVKDVVTSLTRPKPSKPVIEIPRREPPSAIRTQTGSAPPTAHSTTAHSTTAHQTTTQTTTAASVSSSDASATTFKGTSPATQPAETEWVQETAEASYAESASAIAPEQDDWEESNWDD